MEYIKIAELIIFFIVFTSFSQLKNKQIEKKNQTFIRVGEVGYIHFY